MTSESAPSIGTVEMSFDPVGNRVRRILPETICRGGDLVPALLNANMFAEKHGATRSIVRALVPNDLLQESALLAGTARWGIEAAVPLTGRFSGMSFVYYTRNREGRFSSSQTVSGELSLLDGVMARSAKNVDEILRQTKAGGWSLEFLDNSLSESDMERLAQMYASSFKSYPFNIAQAISGMVTDPNVHVCVARSESDGLLYAVSATELVTLPSSGFVMREMGDSAKMPGVNGLNAPLKIMLIAESFRRDSRIDLIFCETRAALGAVNAINHSIGMRWCGMLPKHTVISGPSDVDEVALDGRNGVYGNMNVWALSEKQIRSISSLTEVVQ